MNFKMKDVSFFRNKKNFLAIGIILILVIFFVMLNREIQYGKYVLVSLDDNVFQNVNSNLFFMEKFSKSDVKKLENLFENGEDQENDIEFLKKMSDSFLIGYFYLLHISSNDSIVIDDLSDKDIAWLIYYFTTFGNESVCIKKEYYQELAYRYFGRANFNYFNYRKGVGYDFLRHSYCFKKHSYDIVSDFKFYDYDIEVDGWFVTLHYYELNEVSTIVREWMFQFGEDNGYYRLSSIQIKNYS